MNPADAAISNNRRRQPPEIIFVPPPKRAPIRSAVIVASAGVLVVVGVVFLVMLSSTAAGPRIFIASLYVGMGLFFAAVFSLQNRKHTLRRAEFLERHPPDGFDPRVAALGELWSRSGRRSRFVNNIGRGAFGLPRFRIGVGGDVRSARRLPSVDRVRKILLANDRGGGGDDDTPPGLDWPESPNDPPPATIISFGEADVPEVGELHFEPEIITPTGAIWKQLFGVLPAAILIVWWTLDYLNWLPPWIPDISGMLGAFGYFFVSAVIVMGTWAWKGMLRPTYIRMAPGVIQVLRFGYSKSKPTIRSYPAEPGTLAVFTRLGRHLVLTLSRGENQDTISFSRMRETKRRIERAWQALLSTAPTPPLSEEGLVG